MQRQLTVIFAGLVLLGFVVTGFAAPQIANRSAQLVNNSRQVAWEYARLISDGTEATWQAGETNQVQQTFPLETVYRQLGGRSRSNLTNLLNRIGQEGWELVATDEVTWTFKRQR